MKLIHAILVMVLLPLTFSSCFAADYIIDVRSNQEYASGHVENSLNIVHSEIVKGVAMNDIKKDDTIYLYCFSGKRAQLAKSALENAGYTNVISLGGYEDAMLYFQKHPLENK